MSLFKREVSVAFGKPGEQGIEIKGLRIAFEVIKDDTSTPNSGEITIYNLSKDTAASLSEDKDQIVQLKAGYEGSSGLIFLGDIEKSPTKLEGPDRKTYIESGDGRKAVQSAKISKSYGKGTPSKDVIGDAVGNLASKLGIDPKKAKDKVASFTKDLLPPVEPFPRGVTLAGSTSKSLSRVLKANKLDWMILDGEIVVYKAGKAQGEAFVLSPQSGLIGSPSLTDKKRLELKCLLNPELRPGLIVKVESKEFTGFYVIRRVKFTGDSGWEQAFYAELELTAVGG